MKVSEQLMLIAKGYSKKEIEALKAQELEELQAESEKKEDPKEEPKEDPKQDPKEEPDYKALYEEQLKKNQETAKNLQDLQKKNSRADISDELSKMESEAQKSLEDLARSFM